MLQPLGCPCECKSSGERRGIDSQQSRLLGTIEIQTTGVIAIADAKRNKADILQIAFAKAEKFAARFRVQIVHDGHGALTKQSKAASAGTFFERVQIGVEAEDANGRN